MTQRHGADVYLSDGRESGLLDFSSSVVEVPPPAAWKPTFSRALESLRRYPQPYAAGLAQRIERSLKLPQGSVLITLGSSEGLSWIAQSLRGKRVLLESPCFGEYESWLSRAGARVREIGADEPYSPDWERLSKALQEAQAFWCANPSNPSGLELSRAEFRQRLNYCRERGILFVFDEALLAQSLNSLGDEFLHACASRPGAIVARSLSKGLGLPGLRLGYLAGHPKEIAKLGGLADPWTIGSLSQAVGAWVFDTERRLLDARREALQSWKLDLLKRLSTLPKQSLWPRPSDTGFFLCRLLGKLDDSSRLAGLLRKRGMLVRSCASYGGWGSGHIRLNPRAPKDNARLVKALQAVYAQA
jgi:threonine-phosphate decarboxylase